MRSPMTTKVMLLTLCLLSVMGLTNLKKPITQPPWEIFKEITADEAYERGKAYMVFNEAEAQATAEKWLRIAAIKGHVQAQHCLAIVVSGGLFAGDSLKPKGFEWFQRAANAGYSLSQVSVGVAYHNGWIVERDYAKARYWYELAAAQGNAYALLNLGNMYREAIGVETDEAKALEYYRNCWEDANPGWAPEGDPAVFCKYKYAKVLRYSDNFYLDKQRERSVEVFKQLAEEADHGKSQFQYGYALASGIGVERNETLAIDWYLKAAKQGIPGAMNNLAVMYKGGRGVTENPKEAFRWAVAGAKGGDTNATAKVCAFILNGYGRFGGQAREQRYLEGLPWCLLSVEKGNEATHNMLVSSFGDDYSQHHAVFSMSEESLYARFAE
jgi:TPR repeat protein